MEMTLYVIGVQQERSSNGTFTEGQDYDIALSFALNNDEIETLATNQVEFGHIQAKWLVRNFLVKLFLNLFQTSHSYNSFIINSKCEGNIDTEYNEVVLFSYIVTTNYLLKIKPKTDAGELSHSNSDTLLFHLAASLSYYFYMITIFREKVFVWHNRSGVSMVHFNTAFASMKFWENLHKHDV